MRKHLLQFYLHDFMQFQHFQLKIYFCSLSGDFWHFLQIQHFKWNLISKWILLLQNVYVHKHHSYFKSMAL